MTLLEESGIFLYRHYFTIVLHVHISHGERTTGPLVVPIRRRSLIPSICLLSKTHVEYWNFFSRQCAYSNSLPLPLPPSFMQTRAQTSASSSWTRCTYESIATSSRRYSSRRFLRKRNGSASLLVSGLRIVWFGRSYEIAKLIASENMLLLNTNHWLQKAICEARKCSWISYLQIEYLMGLDSIA
jgi:hypothetical protein